MLVRQLANPWCFLRLRDTVQALALPAGTQLSLYPNGCCKADELALDFDNWWRCVDGNDGERFTVDQRLALEAIDKAISKMSGSENSHLWTEDALREQAEWKHVRELARKALDAFGWPHEPPANYNGPREDKDLDIFFPSTVTHVERASGR